ncbi:MAG: hypothetical protein ACT4TC_19755 [Myxococcaceae bacterium]
MGRIARFFTGLPARAGDALERVKHGPKGADGNRPGRQPLGESFRDYREQSGKLWKNHPVYSALVGGSVVVGVGYGAYKAGEANGATSEMSPAQEAALNSLNAEPQQAPAGNLGWSEIPMGAAEQGVMDPNALAAMLGGAAPQGGAPVGIDEMSLAAMLGGATPQGGAPVGIDEMSLAAMLGGARPQGGAPAGDDANALAAALAGGAGQAGGLPSAGAIPAQADASGATALSTAAAGSTSPGFDPAGVQALLGNGQ